MVVLTNEYLHKSLPTRIVSFTKVNPTNPGLIISIQTWKLIHFGVLVYFDSEVFDLFHAPKKQSLPSLSRSTTSWSPKCPVMNIAYPFNTCKWCCLVRSDDPLRRPAVTSLQTSLAKYKASMSFPKIAAISSPSNRRCQTSGVMLSYVRLAWV